MIYFISSISLVVTLLPSSSLKNIIGSECRQNYRICAMDVEMRPVTEWQVKKSEQVAQLSQRDRAVGWVSYGQKWKTGIGRQYLLYKIWAK